MEKTGSLAGFSRVIFKTSQVFEITRDTNFRILHVSIIGIISYEIYRKTFSYPGFFRN